MPQFRLLAAHDSADEEPDKQTLLSLLTSVVSRSSCVLQAQPDNELQITQIKESDRTGLAG